MLSEVPLQADMFTGQLVDNRTRQQKQLDDQRQHLTQLDLFSQREVAQFGVRANPVMPLSPGRLKLISVDPRTDEEIERDRIREAEKLTVATFNEQPGMYSCKRTALIEVKTTVFDAEGIAEPTEGQNGDPVLIKADEVDDDEPEELPPAPKPLTKIEAYLNLVKAAEERALRVEHTTTTQIAEKVGMSAAKLAAQLAGLTGDEIATALTIGDFRGKTIVDSQQIKTPATTAAKATDEEMPILWTSRADMMRRRPDLAEQLKSLSDDEIADLAWFVGEALEEFYWIQLNVVLALRLDHDLRTTIVAQ